MPYYPAIRRYVASEKTRTIEGLQRLRDKLDRDIPPRDLEDTLLLATWNIRDL